MLPGASSFSFHSHICSTLIGPQASLCRHILLYLSLLLIFWEEEGRRVGRNSISIRSITLSLSCLYILFSSCATSTPSANLAGPAFHMLEHPPIAQHLTFCAGSFSGFKYFQRLCNHYLNHLSRNVFPLKHRSGAA